MTATENIRSVKLKIKIGSKLIGANHGTKQCGSSQGLELGNKSNTIESHGSVIRFDTSKVKFSSMGSNKRGLLAVGDGQKEKRRKIDRSVTQQCAVILKQLMTHPAGWVFNQPVDPVKLQIPDYYLIISHPMDLGTVKKLLNKNEYSSVDEFAAHVRLTFSNAMRYNPPENNVHLMAKELNDLFNLEWNALEAKWSGDHKVVQAKPNVSGIVKCTDKSDRNGNKNTLSYARSESGSLLSDVEKQKLREQLLELARWKVPSNFQGFLRKIGLDLQRVDKIEEIVDSLGYEDLLELKKITSSLVVRTGKVVPAKETELVSQLSQVKVTLKGTDKGIGSASGADSVIPPPKSVITRCDLQTKVTHKGTDKSIGIVLGNASIIPPPKPLISQCESCHSMRCECNKRSEKALPSNGPDILSEGSRDHLDIFTRDCNTKLNSDSQLRKSERESKGARSALREEHISSGPPVSVMDAHTTSTEGCAPLLDVPLSPQKALRAALLKSRFADTILKAKQKALQDQGEITDPVKLQQEKERLERQQREERARLEAQIRAAEEAAQKKAEAERMMQRDREREAARLALQQMVKTVEIVNDHKVVEDLELLSGCSFLDQLSCGSCESSPGVSSGERGLFVKALEQLGLFMKDDYIEDEDDDDVAIISVQGDGGEEGEIFH